MYELLQLDLPDQPHAIPGARTAARGLAEAMHLPEPKRDRVELAVEEAVGNAVRHAYAGGRGGRLRVAAMREGGALVLRVQDWGVPFYPGELAAAAESEHRGLGLLLAFRMADEATYRALGRDGKLFEFRFRLPIGMSETAEPPAAVPPRPGRLAVTVRPFRPEDAPGVARCAWLAYGYTRPDDALYDPADLVRRNATGEALSFVAVTDDGTVVAHGLLDFSANPLAPEFTDLVVAPEARGNPVLLGRLLELAHGTVEAGGWLGWMVQAVTAHTVSQRGALRFGGVPAYVHLGSTSTAWQIGATEGSPVRQSEIGLFRALRPGAARVLHPPRRHRALVAGIYAALGEPVTLGPDDAVPATGETRLTVSKSFAAWGHVALAVQDYGADAVPVVAGFLRDFCLEGVATVLLRLPLARPATAALGDAFEALGFSICGVLPHAGAEDADLLIYQYLNNVTPETSGEQVAAGCRPL